MTESFSLAIEGVDQMFQVDPELPLLEQLYGFGINPRRACRNGVCQICDAELLAGSVFQRYPRAEFSAPATLYLCTSFARSDLRLKLIRAEF
jgi:ferredoxin